MPGKRARPVWREAARKRNISPGYGTSPCSPPYLEAAADAGRPLRAREFAAAVGLPTGKAKVEGLRSKLRLLAGRGWLAPAPGGLYSLPGNGEESAKPGQ
jgi:hypothetical protein